MTIKEIKNLTKFLTDEDLDKIKEEIKSKESILKTQDVPEEELGQVLNTLFAILVIEKTLEAEIEGVEEIRAELEQELLEEYEVYDNHMAKYKKEEKKKKKKNWLLDFLFMSEEMKARQDTIGASKKEVAAMQKELNALRQFKSNENLRNVMRDLHGPCYDAFCDCIHKCDNPFHDHDHHDHHLGDFRDMHRDRNLFENIQNDKISLDRFMRPMNNLERYIEANSAIIADRRDLFNDINKLSGSSSKEETREFTKMPMKK